MAITSFVAAEAIEQLFIARAGPARWSVHEQVRIQHPCFTALGCVCEQPKPYVNQRPVIHGGS